jgi:hypothetical protein
VDVIHLLSSPYTSLYFRKAKIQTIWLAILTKFENIMRLVTRQCIYLYTLSDGVLLGLVQSS